LDCDLGPGARGITRGGRHKLAYGKPSVHGILILWVMPVFTHVMPDIVFHRVIPALLCFRHSFRRALGKPFPDLLGFIRVCFVLAISIDPSGLPSRL